jgi:hypothetical protein
VPSPDSSAAVGVPLFDHSNRTAHRLGWYFEAKLFGSLQVDHQFEAEIPKGTTSESISRGRTSKLISED